MEMSCPVACHSVTADPWLDQATPAASWVVASCQGQSPYSVAALSVLCILSQPWLKSSHGASFMHRALDHSAADLGGMHDWA